MLMEHRSTDMLGAVIAFIGLAVLFTGLVFVERGWFKHALVIGAIVLSVVALMVLFAPRLNGRN